jgi:cation transport ATPase
MVNTYPVQGLHCQACVSKTTDALLRLGDIEAVAVTLVPPEAVVRTRQPISVAALTDALRSAGLPYTITEPAASATSAPSREPPTEAEPGRSWFATYKPVLLVVGFALGGALLREGIAGRWAWQTAMSNFMGGYFVAFAFFKLLDLPGFAGAYRGYDVLARRVPAWGYVYPFVELGLGVLFLTGLFPVWVNAATLALMLLGLAGVVQSLRAKRTIQCACLGTGFDLPMSTVTIIEDGGMAMMAVVMLVRHLE